MADVNGLSQKQVPLQVDPRATMRFLPVRCPGSHSLVWQLYIYNTSYAHILPLR